MTAALAGSCCAIVGGGGFLGTTLAPILQQHGADVRIFARTFYFKDALSGMRLMPGSLDDTQKLSCFLEGADVVYHLAGSSMPATSELNRLADVDATLKNSISLLDSCLKLGIRKVIFVSSGGTVYGDAGLVACNESTMPQPQNSYGINKLAAEHYFILYNRLHGMSNIVLRVANPYGPFQTGLKKQGVIAVFAQRAIAGKPVEIMGDGYATRDYVFSHDVARAMLAAATYPGGTSTFNIGSGVGRTLNQVVDALREILNADISVEYKPSRIFDVKSNTLNCKLALRELSWSAKSDWMESLTNTCNWLKKEAYSGS